MACGGTLSILSGCQSVSRYVDKQLGDRTHFKDAPVDGMDGPWPGIRGGSMRRSYSPRDIGPTDEGKLKQIGPANVSGPTQQPVVSSTGVLIPLSSVPSTAIDDTTEEFDGTLAVTHGGIQLWHIEGQGGPVAATGNAVILPTNSGIQVVDQSDGSICWQFKKGNYPTVVDDLICVENHDQLFGLDAQTGTVRWSSENFSGDDSFKYTLDAFAAGEKLLCGTRNIDYDAPSLVAMDATTGAVLWRGDIRPSAHPPVIGPEQIYVLTKRDTLHAFTHDGSKVWSKAVKMKAPPAVGENRLFATIPETHDVVARDPTTGDEQWRTEVGPGVSLTPAATPTDVFVIHGNENGDSVAVSLNPESGAIQWTRHLSISGKSGVTESFTNPALTEEGLVFSTGHRRTPEDRQGTYIF